MVSPWAPSQLRQTYKGMFPNGSVYQVGTHSADGGNRNRIENYKILMDGGGMAGW